MVPHLYINYLSGDVICVIICVDDTAIQSNCNLASDLWKQLELASGRESGVQDIVNCDRKWLVDFSDGKSQLNSFDKSGVIDVKMDGSVFEENYLLRCWDCLSLLNWIGVITVSLLLKLPLRKWEP